MRSATASLLSCCLNFAACSDGSGLVAFDAGMDSINPGSNGSSSGGSGSNIVGTGSSSSGSNTSGNGGSSSGGSSSGGSSSGGSGNGGSGNGGSGNGGRGNGGAASSGAAMPRDASVASSGGSSSGGSSSGGSSIGMVVGPDPYSGPFKVLVLSKTVGFHHDSIPAGQQMLRDLGKCVDATSCAMTKDTVIAGAKPNSSFTVDVAGAPATCPAATPANYAAYGAMGCDGSKDDLSEFTTENLKNYELLFFVSPTGNVFSAGGPNGKLGMAAIQAFIEGGGGYGGLHGASDFENTGGFPWYYNTMMGAFFTLHNNDGTPGSVITAPMYASHPVMRGLPSPLSTQDEWYFMNRQISAQPGFQILATLSGVPPVAGESATDIRPIVWIKQFPVAANPVLEGRMFYTCRGHNIARFGEPDFRQLVHQGILWAVHRLN